jgi:hypothetical protein
LISACSGLPILDAARLGGRRRLACALADHISLVLGSGGEHIKRQMIRAWHIGNGEIEPLESLSAAIKATALQRVNCWRAPSHSLSNRCTCPL